MNYFFAFKVHTFTHHVISMFARQWQQSLPLNCNVNWYEATDYHITLRFLGNLSAKDEVSLFNFIAPIAAQTVAFWVDVANYGAFPNLAAPRVLWMGISDCKELQQLVLAINGSIENGNYVSEERAFHPHITIGRCRGLCGDLTLPYQPPSLDLRFGSFVVDGFTLMQTLTPEQRAKEGKSRYNIVQTFSFGTTHTPLQ